MALRTLRFIGDPILTKKAKPIRIFDDTLETLIDDMIETMRSHEGVGLAAPQVGSLKRVVVIDVGEGIVELVNPEIVSADGIQKREEGCLSIPGVRGVVERPESVKVVAFDRNGNSFELEGREIMAIALSHEIDHLNGLLFVEKQIEESEK